MENMVEYMLNSKTIINKALKTHNYKLAFDLLVVVLSNLNERNKIIFLQYYSKYILNINQNSKPINVT
jgi:hypothetical protein